MDDIPELNLGHVHIRDRDHVTSVIRKMIEGGPDKLQVCSEFDFTLTNNKGDCMFGIFEKEHIDKDFPGEARGIRNKYMPIELDSKLSMEDKKPYMLEWWTQALGLMVKYRINKNMIGPLVSQSTARLRDGCGVFLDTLRERGVPLLILSGGVGDAIEETIRQQSTLSNNIQIVSNFMEFNEKGDAIGFKGDLMHAFNKNENPVHSSPYFEQLKDRVNVLVLGCSVGDLQLAKGARHRENMLTIGYLGTGVEENLELFKSNFDIVIARDQTMDVTNAITRRIVGISTWKRTLTT